MPIHPAAIVDPRACIDPDARIDAYAIVDGPVKIAAGVHLYPHSFVAGWTEIGAGCQIHPGAVVGHEPQDLAYKGAETYCRVGEGTIVREGASIHRGTQPGSATVVGRRCFLMAGAHVAHNCEVGDEVVLVNGVALAGHVRVGHKAFFGGGAMAHQFTRVGELAMVAGAARVARDVPPFMLTDEHGRIAGINVIGLRRAGYGPDVRADIKRAHRLLYREMTNFSEAARRLSDVVTTDAGRRLAEFVCAPSKRGCVQAALRRRGAVADEEQAAAD